MRSIILLLCLISLASISIYAQKYKHKSEVEISRLTPAQRVDEWVNEQVYHRFDVLDRQKDLLRKHLTKDSLAAMPRFIEIIDEYDPTRGSGKSGRKGERFQACWLMMGYIDEDAVRLRGTEEGKQAMDALERAIERMRAAGYSDKEKAKYTDYLSLELAMDYLDNFKGLNLGTDPAIKETLRREYKISLSNDEMMEFVNFLVAHYPEYPGWSRTNYFADPVLKNNGGGPLMVRTMEEPERYYQAYLEFKDKMKISHLGIATKGIDEALKFWEHALGLENVHTETVEDQKVRVAMLPLGETNIELLEPTSEDSPISKFLEKRGGGIHHIAVEVEDIHASLAKLKAEGARLIDESPRIGAENCLVAFVHPASSGGVLLELTQKIKE